MAPRSRPRFVEGRSSQRRQKPVSYREDSTDDTSDEGVKAYKQSSTGNRKRRALRSGPSLHNKQAPSKKRKYTDGSPPRASNTRVMENEKDGKSNKNSIKLPKEMIHNSRIPPWQTLPYHVLFEIFCYTSPALLKSTPCPTSPISWLFQVALLCKSFSEPALSVLHYDPPLDSPLRAQSFLAHLLEQDDRSAFNYRAKVKYFTVENMDIVYRKHKGHDPLDMADLIAVTPQLRGLCFHLPRPSIHHRLLPTNSKARLKEKITSIIGALQGQAISLQEWKWNSATMDTWAKDAFVEMENYHKTSPFRLLTRLTISGFSVIPSVTAPETQLASAICALPNLQELHLAMSSLVNNTLLPLLPSRLKVLSLTATEVDSKTFSAFLTSHGRELRRLSLSHNQMLNLSFLVSLAQTCPALESLVMDLTYLDKYPTLHDNNPRYASVLFPHEIPTWPSSLQQLELLHVRRWDMKTADVFFRSLVSGAQGLPNLRSINIKASLNESGWRERVNFRDRWVAAFKKVFKRVSPPPNPHLASIGAFRAYQARQVNTPRSRRRALASSVTENPKNSTRALQVVVPLAVTPKQECRTRTASVDSRSSDEPLVHRRRSTRLRSYDDIPLYADKNAASRLVHRRHRRTKASDEDSSSEDSAMDDDTSFDEDGRLKVQVDLGRKPFIQGMCDVVRLSIDNLRPTEEQLNENDFLDEEVSGDEDWNGDDIDVNDGYAW